MAAVSQSLLVCQSSRVGQAQVQSHDGPGRGLEGPGGPGGLQFDVNDIHRACRDRNAHRDRDADTHDCQRTTRHRRQRRRSTRSACGTATATAVSPAPKRENMAFPLPSTQTIRPIRTWTTATMTAWSANNCSSQRSLQKANIQHHHHHRAARAGAGTSDTFGEVTVCCSVPCASSERRSGHKHPHVLFHSPISTMIRVVHGAQTEPKRVCSSLPSLEFRSERDSA